MSDLNLDGSRVAVIGGAGFVGSNLCHKLLEHSLSQLAVVDNLLSAERINLPEDDRVIFFEGSICSDAILHALGTDYDYVFHLAGTVQAAALDTYMAVNVDLTRNVLEACKQAKRLKKLVVVSSMAATGPAKNGSSANEASPMPPISN